MGEDKIKYEDLILDAIDQLRHRKARPDAERIFNSLFRRHAINCNDAKQALEKCVENGIVLRVAYKGNISYRNAAKKFSHLKRDNQGELIRVAGGAAAAAAKPRRKFTALLTNAFAELIILEPDYLDHGVPHNELMKAILAKDSARYTRKYVSILLDKEVENGSLIRMENGNYLVGPDEPPVVRGGGGGGNGVGGGGGGGENASEKFKKKTATTIAATSTTQITTNSSTTTTPTKQFKTKDRFMDSLRNEERRNENLRVGGRRKRAKKVFDPSDNNLPKKRGRPLGSLGKNNPNNENKQTSTSSNASITLSRQSDGDSRPESRTSQNGQQKEPGGNCSVCDSPTKKDKMISCKECCNKAHLSCLNGDVMLKLNPDNTWQCPQCKTCDICYETAEAGQLIVCSQCVHAYHLQCYQPKLLERPKKDAKWTCANCQIPDEILSNESNLQIDCTNNTIDMTTSTQEEHDNETTHLSPVLSRATSPMNDVSLPPSPTPPTLSPQPLLLNGRDKSPIYSDSHSFIKEEYEYVEENIDPTIPDATNWTSDDVYQYFARYFPDEAIVFKDQEIDGHSLLLMKRMDVLKGLALKLGPALKIYRHVLKLQYRRDDPKLYWV